MASAQVTSRKQQHMDAGRRRLEEFRRRKAAAAAAAGQTAAPSQPEGSTSAAEKQVSENGQVELENSVSASANWRVDMAAETSSSVDNDDQSRRPSNQSSSESVLPATVNYQSHDSKQPDASSTQPQQEDYNESSFGSMSQSHTTYLHSVQDGVAFSGSTASRDNSTNYFYSNYNGVEDSLSSKDLNSSKSLTSETIGRSNVASEPWYSSHANLEIKDHLTSAVEDKRSFNAVGYSSNFYNQQASDPFSSGDTSDGVDNLNGSFYSSVTETHCRRSRPSFLDSLNISKDSPSSARPFSEKENYANFLFPSSNVVAQPVMQQPPVISTPVEPLPTPASSHPTVDYFGSGYRDQKLFENSYENKLDSHSQKQNEDFAALEQHIEDLTQEKYSLQRALDASKALSESLAAENSSLTESYNQQASVVSQLRGEMERLQVEIKARLVELESFKGEYMNAQLECNAADERAKLLASEVINLEEKALRLRSQELKLERELENSSAEIASYKKKLASLDRERQDLLQTIDALQEEKKVLQKKLRRASASGISIDLNKGHGNRDASTSTDGLAGVDGDFSGLASDVQMHDDAGSLLSILQNISSVENSMSIPADQLQMIENINSLISEITAEKEELVQALATEVSTGAKLKELNTELSHKLAIQTQRLELLTAQSMASENVTGKELAAPRVVRESVAYADEGDEVVERVLGWIMKLFPGGPSKRRTSRL